MDSIIQYSLLVTSLILNGIAGIKSHQIAESRIKYPYMPLPDIIHDNLPRINHHIPDYILAVVIGSTIIKGLISSNFQTELQLGLNPLICSLFLRSATVIVTIIPTCTHKLTHPNIYQKICTSTHDLIFSGHTLLFIFFGKLIEENDNPFFYITGKMIQFILPISLIMSRQHYTIDVIISMIVYHFFTCA